MNKTETKRISTSLVILKVLWLNTVLPVLQQCLTNRNGTSGDQWVSFIMQQSTGLPRSVHPHFQLDNPLLLSFPQITYMKVFKDTMTSACQKESQGPLYTTGQICHKCN